MKQEVGDSAASPARTILLVACALCFVLLVWDAIASQLLAGSVGYDADDTFRIFYVVPGAPAARAGLRVGDKILFAEGSLANRIANNSRFIVGHPQVFPVLRENRLIQITVVPVAEPRDGTYWPSILLDVWMIGFAFFVALRGTGRLAILLSWFLLVNALGGAGLLGATPGPGLSFITPWPWLNVAAYILAGPVNALGLALVATIASVFARPLNSLRQNLTWAAYAAAAVLGILWALQGAAPIIPWALTLNPPVFTLWAVALVLAAACVVAALQTVRGSERQRAAWLLIPLTAWWLFTIVVSAASFFVGGYWSGGQVALGVATNILFIVCSFAFTYAVLRRRLLDFDFVINRAAVFAGVSLIVVGAFILVEWLLDSVFSQSGRTAGILVNVAVALALGMSLRYIHLYVDRVVDRVFFRARHEHERSLRTFAHEAAYVTDYETLLDDAAGEVLANAEANRVSILIRDDDGSYATVRDSNGSAERVNENDRAILKMRSWHIPVDLHDVTSELGGALAFPLVSRGDVIGVLVCGEKRDGQLYAPDEKEALSSLAQGVGAALGALRSPQDDLRSDVRDLKVKLYEIHDALRILVNEPVRDSDNTQVF